MHRYLKYFLALLMLGATAAYAMSITPVVLDLEETGGRSSGSIAVTNPNAFPMPVEFTIAEIVIDERGSIVDRKPADEDFIILPPQAIVAPGGTQNFRVQYVGEGELKQSRLFQYSVDQVPVKPEDDGNAQIQIVYSITGLLTLAPLEGSSNVSVVGGGIEVDDKGVARATVTLRNDGNRHAYLSRGSLTVRQTGPDGGQLWRESLSATRIEKEVGFGLLAPFQSRTFVLPYELPSREGTVTAEFNAGSQK